MPPALTVLCPAAHPGWLVSRTLSAVRDVADEIVVAADSRVGGETLAAYATVADRVIRYEHIGASRHWAWLAAQADGDWVLILDGDELCSADLVAALPELMADRDVAQHSMPIHWPWPGPATRLVSEPWRSDRRLRLLRNDDRLQFPGGKHTLAAPAGPIRYHAALPVHHLDLLIAGEQDRRAKVASYDRERFGMLAPDGRPYNAAHYLPEGRQGLETEEIPAVDRDRIAAVLAGGQAGSDQDPARRGYPRSLPLADATAVARHWPGRRLGDAAHRGAVAFAAPLPTFAARGRRHRIWARADNLGNDRWPGGADVEPLIRLGLIWHDAGGDAHDVGRAALPHAVAPGGDALVPIDVDGPPEPGPARLEVRLVHEGVRWFGSAAVAEVDVHAAAADRLAGLAGKDGRVGLADLLALRSDLGRVDALADDVWGAPPPSRHALLGGAVPPGAPGLVTAESFVATALDSTRARTVVEFGSGPTTVALARGLAARHGAGRAKLVTIEHDPVYADLVEGALARCCLSDVVTLVRASLQDDPGLENAACYASSAPLRAALDADPPDLVVVDGPPLSSGASRLGVLDLVAPHLRGDARILLLDALRDAELSVALAWSKRADVVVDGVRAEGSGVLEAVLRTPPRLGWPRRRAAR